MIKRDLLTRLVPTREDDDMGGGPIEYETKESIPAFVSVSASLSDMTQYGVQDQMMLSTATDYELDNITPNVRYEYSGRKFQMLRQQKVGTEYLQVFKEVTN